MNRVHRKVPIKAVAASLLLSIVLFLIAAPFGHDKHGIGRIMSDIFWPLFLLSALLFVILAVTTLIQAVRRRS